MNENETMVSKIADGAKAILAKSGDRIKETFRQRPVGSAIGRKRGRAPTKSHEARDAEPKRRRRRKIAGESRRKNR